MAGVQRLVNITVIICQMALICALIEMDVLEESPPNTYVGNVILQSDIETRFDPDTITSMEFDFLSQPNQDHSYFTIEPTSGIIRTSDKKMNRDTLCPGMVTCSKDVTVAIVKPLNLFEEMTIRFTVLDMNDNEPYFQPNKLQVHFSEASQVGSSVPLPIALDVDSPIYGVKRYEILSGPAEFGIEVLQNGNSVTGLKLKLERELDREVEEFYQVRIAAFDSEDVTHRGALLVNVTVDDANDHKPVFVNTTSNVEVHESFPLDTILFKVQAVDPDSGIFGTITYSFSSFTESQYGSIFGIRSVNGYGEIYLKSNLDYETQTEYNLTIQASDGGIDSTTATTTLRVRLIDVNDYSPQVTINTLTDNTEAYVAEHDEINKFVAHISVFDGDSGPSGNTSCTVTDPAFWLEPVVNKSSYKMRTAVNLDREVKGRYVVGVMCSDMGSPSLSGSQNLTVIVTDINDHIPVFTQELYEREVIENNPSGSVLIRVSATDNDEDQNGRVTYSMTEGEVTRFINIEPSTGIIRSTVSLDYETVKVMKFVVVAHDNGEISKSSSASVTISVLDVNDNRPEFDPPAHYSFSVLENQPKDTTVGQISAHDDDSSVYNQFVFSLKPSVDSRDFYIEAETGLVKTNEPLDRENQNVYHLVAIATDLDDPRLTSTAEITISIADENDNHPVLFYPTKENDTFIISNAVPVGYEVLEADATDADININANLTYILLDSADAPFVIESRSGMVQTTKQLTDISYEEFKVTILVRDNGPQQKADTADITIIVDGNKPYEIIGREPAPRKTNLTTIIAVATVSGVVMVILIIAIVCIIRRDKHKANVGKYMQRIEIPYNPDERKAPEGSSKKEVSFDLEDDQVKIPRSSSSSDHPGSLHLSGSDVDHADQYDPLGQYKNDRQLEAHLLALLKQDNDAASSSSGEVSNADSGRGPSDHEGEGHNTSRPVIPPRVQSLNANPRRQNHSTFRGGPGTSHPQRHAAGAAHSQNSPPTRATEPLYSRPQQRPHNQYHPASPSHSQSHPASPNHPPPPPHVKPILSQSQTSIYADRNCLPGIPTNSAQRHRVSNDTISEIDRRDSKELDPRKLVKEIDDMFFHKSVVV